MRVDKKRVSLDSPGMQRIRAVLAKLRGPVDGETISKRSCVGERTFSASYQQILIAEGLMHVADYRRNVRGPAVPLFFRGPLIGAPAKKPEPLSDAEVSRRWKERAGYNELRNLNRKLVRPVDPIFAALIGLPSRGRHFKEYHNSGTAANTQEITA